MAGILTYGQNSCKMYGNNTEKRKIMFTIALSNVLLTLLYCIPGYLLCKAGKANAGHLTTLSGVLIYFCSPCMIVSSFLKMDFDLHVLKSMGMFFVVTLFLQTAFMLILWAIFRKNYHESKYRMLTIGSVMGNVGFFGLPIVKALLPDHPEAMCYSAIYVISMNMLVFTVGVFCLTTDKKFMSPKNAVINPSSVSAAVAIILYIFGAGSFLNSSGFSIITDAVDLVGRMTTPMCMIILGIRLATVDMKALFMRPFVYLTCACKLIVYPLFCYGLVLFLPLDPSFKASILILSSVPCASIILNMAEMHQSETELAANSVLVSTLICFMTIPVLAMLI